jgi:hypothetical protein
MNDGKLWVSDGGVLLGVLGKLVGIWFFSILLPMV